MWSLGVILYILLSGRPPFDHSKGMDAINDGISFSGNAWSEISSDATDLIASLLEKNPKQRISIADACSHPWILTKDGDSHEHPLGDPVLLIQDGKRREKFKDDNTSSHTPNIRIRNPQRLNEKNDKSILKGQCSSPSQNANLPTPPNRNLVAAKSNPSWKRNSLLTVVKQLSNGSNGGSVEKEESGKERKNLEHEDSFVGSQSSEVIINETQDDQIGSGNGITQAQVSVKSAPACGQSQLNNLGSAAKSQGKKKTALGVLLEDQALKEGEKTGKPGTQSRDSLKGKQATLSKWILKE
jgi:serine/threonine protein kinase